MKTKPFIAACYGLNVPHVPVWFMRQAGRVFPQYRRVRERHGILDICHRPELAARVALMPIRQLGVDAAILFADIMIPVQAMGIRLKIMDNVGPIISHPITSPRAVLRLRVPSSPEQAYDFIGEAIGILRRDLQPEVALIGFSGAPFTLASYLIEGRPTRDFARTKAMMYSYPRAWSILMSKLSNVVLSYLRYQIGCGVEAIQIFDSWAGCLDRADYRVYVLPYTSRIFSSLKKTGVPRIHFTTGTSAILPDVASVDAEVVGIDWRTPIRDARVTVGSKKTLQGNLDPAALLGPRALVRRKVDEIFNAMGSSRRFIFNTGHGVLPGTRLSDLRSLVRYVHSK